MSSIITKVLLADDHEIVLNGLRTLLQNQHNVEVVAEAKDGRMAVQLASKHEPDLVIMDISMPNLNGIEATRQIKDELPDARVICLGSTECRGPRLSAQRLCIR